MEESAWCNKCRNFKVSGSFLRGRPSKTWNEVIRSGPRERNSAKTTKNRNNRKPSIRKRPTHASMENRC